MDQRKIVIKKYENRRLYDTSNSRYVNLDEIAQMVRDGADVQVLDAATGEDLTRLVLTQIIVESAKTPNSAFPVDVLKQMVIASGQAGREGLVGYMRAVTDMYQNAYRAINPTLMPFDFFRRQTETPGGAPVAESNRASSEAVIAELQQRIEELERRVSAASTAKPSKKSEPRRKR